MIRPVRPLAYLLLTAALAAGCGSEKSPAAGGTPTGTTAPATAATTSASTSATATSGAPGTGPAAERVNALRAALLTTADLGTGFTKTAAPDDAEPGPCEKEPMQKHYPANKQIGASFAAGSDSTPAFATVDEMVVVFPTEALAKAAYTWNKDELSCRRGSIDEGGQKVAFSISPPVDVTRTVGGDQATMWTLTFDANKTVRVAFLAVQFKDTVVDLGFTAGPGEKGMNTFAAISKAGVTRLAAA
jgi:hypothetical protein